MTIDGEPDFRSGEYKARFEAEAKRNESRAGRVLRKYQEDAIKTVLRELHRREPIIMQLATGGGKTFTANKIAHAWHTECFGPHDGGPILWITKDWRLLKQAAIDATSAGCANPEHIRRIGGTGTELHPLKEWERGERVDRKTYRIIYSTIQTITKRLDDQKILRELRLCLVVWDECHWGEHGDSKEILRRCAQHRPAIPVLGLTATPRTDSKFEIVFSRTFHELVTEKILAEPKVKRIETGITWHPTRVAGEVTRQSLDVLAKNTERNRKIVDVYARNRTMFGKTIVFACGIEHTRQLSKLFNNNNIKALGVHSGSDSPTPEVAVEKFKTGQIEILVNMDMLTHGIDTPDAKTVFLCRPTCSDILFAQMIGRAARKPEGKTFFYIVDFIDNTKEHADVLWTAKRYFDASGMPGASSALPRHQIDQPPSRQSSPSHWSPQLHARAAEQAADSFSIRAITFDGTNPSCIVPESVRVEPGSVWRSSETGRRIMARAKRHLPDAWGYDGHQWIEVVVLSTDGFAISPSGTDLWIREQHETVSLGGVPN